jgi:hypothetical protein
MVESAIQGGSIMGEKAVDGFIQFSKEHPVCTTVIAIVAFGATCFMSHEVAPYLPEIVEHLKDYTPNQVPLLEERTA